MAEGKLAGSRILMVIAQDQFRDEEFFEPSAIFSREGAQVAVASTDLGEAKGMLGARVKPELLIKDAKAANFDGIVVVGGMGSPTYLWDNIELASLLREMDRQGKVLSGICLSGAALAKAGVLSGKRATVWPTPESLRALEQGQCQYVKQAVVSDGRAITADGPEAAKEFGQTIVQALIKNMSKV